MNSGHRFHLDENMPIAVAEGLSRRGRDCTISQETNLMGASDPEQLRFAMSESRVIITRDQDFLRIAADNQAHAGVIFWTQTKHFGQLIRDLDQLCFESEADAFRNRVLYL